MYKTRSGFTLVELLIVIVVIAILAAITIIAYNGIQSRATDTRIRTAAADFEKAMHLFAIANDKPLYSGSQSTGTVSNLACPGSTIASGFAGSGTYKCNAEDLLVAAGLLTQGYTSKLPPNPNYSTGSGGRLSLMLYQCGAAANNTYALYWALSNPSADDTASINSTLTTCGNATSIRDTWGMRAAKIVQL